MASEDRLNALRKLVEMDPEDAMARWGLGRVYLETRRWAEASAAFTKAIELNPEYSAAYRDLGRAQIELERPGDALQTLGRGIAVAEQRGDLQTVREMRVFAKRAKKRLGKA